MDKWYYHLKFSSWEEDELCPLVPTTETVMLLEVKVYLGDKDMMKTHDNAWYIDRGASSQWWVDGTILVESNNDNLQEQTREMDVCVFRSKVIEGYLIVKVHTI
jgi:hypothetical protein